MTAVSAAAKIELEKLMNLQDYEFQSDFFKRKLAKGRDEALAQGRAEGQAQTVLAVLDARGLSVSAEACARIRACTDAEQLTAWARKAVTAGSADEIF